MNIKVKLYLEVISISFPFSMTILLMLVFMKIFNMLEALNK